MLIPCIPCAPSMSADDVAKIAGICAVDEATARHYLSVFNGDVQRATEAHFEYASDPNWVHHPPRAGSGEGAEKKSSDPPKTASGAPPAPAAVPVAKTGPAPAPAVPEVSSLKRNLSPRSSSSSSRARVSKTAKKKSSKTSPAPLDIDDKKFYASYSSHVNRFVTAVCRKKPRTPRYKLKQYIDAADDAVARDLLSQGLSEHEARSFCSNLVNRKCFKHKPDEGRTPLCYAAAMNYQQTVHDLIFLGAKVSEVMMEECSTQDGKNSRGSDAAESKSDSSSVTRGSGSGDVSELKPLTALVVAATNERRDGTEIVRILLSKGAKPEELEKYGIDESGLNRTMKYWLAKARKIGTPADHILEHMKQYPPMDRVSHCLLSIPRLESAQRKRCLDELTLSNLCDFTFPYLHLFGVTYRCTNSTMLSSAKKSSTKLSVDEVPM